MTMARYLKGIPSLGSRWRATLQKRCQLVPIHARSLVRPVLHALDAPLICNFYGVASVEICLQGLEVGAKQRTIGSARSGGIPDALRGLCTGRAEGYTRLRTQHAFSHVACVGQCPPLKRSKSLPGISLGTTRLGFRQSSRAHTVDR